MTDHNSTRKCSQCGEKKHKSELKQLSRQSHEVATEWVCIDEQQCLTVYWNNRTVTIEDMERNITDVSEEQMQRIIDSYEEGRKALKKLLDEKP